MTKKPPKLLRGWLFGWYFILKYDIIEVWIAQ